MSDLLTVPGSESVLIPLDRIIADEQFQPRTGGLSESHVRLLMESDPTTWPPLLVSTDDSRSFYLCDGFHRFEAARRLKLVALPSVIVPDAGYPEAVRANVRHGLPLAMSDRKEAARWWASQGPSLSYREIGRRCGLSDKSAKRAIEGVVRADAPQSAPNSDPIRRLVGLAYRAYGDHHGRTMLGLGAGGNPKAFKRQIESYPEDEQADVATALAAFGTAIVEASKPYLARAERR